MFAEHEEKLISKIYYQGRSDHIIAENKGICPHDDTAAIACKDTCRVQKIGGFGVDVPITAG